MTGGGGGIWIVGVVDVLETAVEDNFARWPSPKMGMASLPQLCSPDSEHSKLESLSRVWTTRRLRAHLTNIFSSVLPLTGFACRMV